jgi:transposase InsO family protein
MWKEVKTLQNAHEILKTAAQCGCAMWRRDAAAELLRLIRELVVRHHRRYGNPRVQVVCENLLNREFSASQSGQKWVSDITLRTTDGWVYLTVVMDLYNRAIIGWAFSADLEAAHTSVATLKMVFKNSAAQEGLLFHSDRGVQ